MKNKRENTCNLIHTDPAWSSEQCNMHIMNEELKILDQYNDYFVNYNDVINTCSNYHVQFDENDTCINNSVKEGAESPTGLKRTQDRKSEKDSKYHKNDEKTVCKNPLEIPEQQKRQYSHRNERVTSCNNKNS